MAIQVFATQPVNDVGESIRLLIEVGRVDLTNVARQNDLGVFSRPRDDGFDLVRGEVLGLIDDENDIGQRPTPDVGQGRNLDFAIPLHVFDGAVLPLVGGNRFGTITLDENPQGSPESTFLYVSAWGAGSGQPDKVMAIPTDPKAKAEIRSLTSKIQRPLGLSMDYSKNSVHVLVAGTRNISRVPTDGGQSSIYPLSSLPAAVTICYD